MTYDLSNRPFNPVRTKAPHMVHSFVTATPHECGGALDGCVPEK